MTRRLTDDGRATPCALAQAEGLAMQDAARRSEREFVARRERWDRIDLVAGRIMDAHAAALWRLGKRPRFFGARHRVHLVGEYPRGCPEHGG